MEEVLEVPAMVTGAVARAKRSEDAVEEVMAVLWILDHDPALPYVLL